MTLRTRSVPGHRLFERLFARMSGPSDLGSTTFERFGLEDPFSARWSGLGISRLVYLTLPADDDELDEEFDEDVTAADLVARAGTRERRSRRVRPRSSRRRILDRLEAVAAGRGIRTGDAVRRLRSSDAVRASRVVWSEGGFVWAEPELEPVPTEDTEELSLFGRFSRADRPSARQRRTRLVPAAASVAAGRIEPAPRRARVQRSAAQSAPALRPLERAVHSVAAAPPQAHEAKALVQAARRARGDVAHSLHAAARRAQVAPPHRRERIVRDAIESLPAAARRSIQVEVARRGRTGASPVASVAARLEGIGRGERSLKPVLRDAPVLVPLTFEEPEAPPPSDDIGPKRVVPQAATRARPATSATRDARTQRVASRAGPIAALPASAERPAMPPTQRVATRAVDSQRTTGTPTIERGPRALTVREPARGPVARIIRRVTTASPTESVVPRAVPPSAASGRLAGRVVRAVVSEPATAETPRSGERAHRRTTPPTVRAARRATTSRQSRALLSVPTHYVLPEPEVDSETVSADATTPPTRRAPAPPRSRVASTPGTPTVAVARATRTAGLTNPQALRVRLRRAEDPVAASTSPSRRALVRDLASIQRGTDGALRLAPRPTRHVVRGALRPDLSLSYVDPAADTREPAPTTEPAARSVRTGAARSSRTVRTPRALPPATRAALRGTPAQDALAPSPVASFVERAESPRAETASGPRRTTRIAPGDAPARAAVPADAPRSASPATLRASRRGEALDPVGPRGALWLDTSPMVHVEPVVDVFDEDIVAGASDRPAVRPAVRASRVASRVVSAEEAPSAPSELAAARGRVVPARLARSLPPTVLPEVEQPTVDEAGLHSPLRHAAGRDRVAGRLDSRGARSSLGRPVATASDSTADRVTGAEAAPRSTPSVRASRRGRGVSGGQRRVRLAQIPVSYLEPEQLDAAARDPETRPASTLRAAARDVPTVAVDSRGVGQVFGRPMAHVDVARAAQRAGSLSDLPVRVSRAAGRAVLTIVLPDLEPSEPAAGVARRAVVRREAATVAGGDVSTTAARLLRTATAGAPPRRRRPAAVAPEGTVLVQSAESVTGDDSAPTAARRVVTRVRSVPAGSTAWAAARMEAAQPGAASRSRLARALRSGRRIAVSPARFAGLAGNMAWLEAAAPEASLEGADFAGTRADRGLPNDDSPVGRAATRAEPATPATRTARLAAPETIALEPGEEEPPAVGATRIGPERGTGQLFRRGRRAQRRTGGSRRPFSGEATPADTAPPRRSRRPVAPPATTLAAHPEAEQDLAPDEAPSWARRDSRVSSAGGRRAAIAERASLRAGHSMVNAIARAESPEDLVRIVTERGMTAEQLRSTLPGPAVKLVERIVHLERLARQEERNEARHVMGVRMRGTGPTPDFVRARPGSSPVRQFLPGATAAQLPGVGAAKITNLANKLLKLIHLAEVEGRVQDAQQEVRMSDSEVGAVGASESSGSDSRSPNMKALKREVFDAVVQQLGAFDNRSTEDPDGYAIWW